MRSDDITGWGLKNSTEFFYLSHQALEFSTYFNRFVNQEIRFNVDTFFASIDLLFAGNISELRQLQLDFYTRAISHTLGYQRHSRNRAKEIQKKIGSGNEDYLYKSIELFSEFMEEGDKTIPIGSKRMANAIRVAASTAGRTNRIGQNLVNIAIENVDQVLDRYIAPEDSAIKG